MRRVRCPRCGVVVEAEPLGPRLGARRFEGEHDVAQGARACRRQRLAGERKGEHVGGLVLAAPGGVEGAHLVVVAQDDRDLCGRAVRSFRVPESGPQRLFGGTRQKALVEPCAAPSVAMAHELHLEPPLGGARWRRFSRSMTG